MDQHKKDSFLPFTCKFADFDVFGFIFSFFFKIYTVPPYFLVLIL
jgi:hypothetical protein